MVYQGDQVPNRNSSDYLFGEPKNESSATPAYSTSNDDGDDEDSNDDDEDSDNGEDDEDEDEDE